MDNKLFSETLYHVSAQTLELFSMLFLVPEDEAPVKNAVLRNSAAVNFTGSFSGTLAISVSDDVLTEIASNMLGLPDESPSAEQQQDALKEMANVICGNYLPAIAGGEPIFHISAPVLIKEPEQGGISARLFTDKGLVKISVIVNEHVAAG